MVREYADAGITEQKKAPMDQLLEGEEMLLKESRSICARLAGIRDLLCGARPDRPPSEAPAKEVPQGVLSVILSLQRNMIATHAESMEILSSLERTLGIVAPPFGTGNR
jgi:hypothetical protein